MRFRLGAYAAISLLATLPLFAQQAAAPPANQGPHPKSQKELEALQKVQAAAQAKNPDGELAAITEVLENFADTDFKPQLLNMAMGAAEQKGDDALVITWGERVIQSDPNDVAARVSMAERIAAHTREHDLNKADSIAKATGYANKALELLKAPATPAPAGIPADQWPSYKKELTSQAYDALGQVAAVDKKYPEAITNFKMAMDASPNPVSMARLAKTYVDSKQYDDAISTADKVLAMNDAPPQVKQFAQAQKDAATKMKGAK
jgi:tetratricopeptide (TPR) repeat protein